ncbi:MAG: hypothetical protein AAB131_16080, partial [Actinomycetota bacterium]
RVKVTFTAASLTAVLAWGGHIARAADWGVGNSATGISGSPYHMRLIGWSIGNLGQQDRSLAASAVLGTITIVKNTVGGDGAFGYTTTGQNVPTNLASFSLTTSGGTASQPFAVLGDKTYAVTESSLPAGWSLTGIACNDPTANSTIDLAAKKATIVVDDGESITCTFTNELQKATLKVIKHVINDNGGTKVAADFPIAVSGNNPNPTSFNGQESPGTTVEIYPGSYNVTETVDPGYAASYSTDCTGSIASGQTKTCVVTNNDKPAKLIVVKHVINDNGGTKQASDFPIQVSGNSPNPATFAGAESPGTEVAIGPGSYGVTETENAAYAASYSVDCSGSIALGETKTCTITNNDQPATLIVKKVVVNDNGGTKQAQDFSFQVNGGAAQSFEADGQNNLTVSAGTYNVVEPGVAGYTTSYDNCSNLVIPLGGSETCTITNNDQAPKLTLVKVVVNNDGGTAQPNAWTLTAAGSTGFSGLGPSVSSGASFDQGNYNLSEAGPAGYAGSDWVCTGGQVDGDTVSVGLGDDITCTITNNDKPATLIVKKVVINDNGGTKVASDFSFQVNGGAAQSFEPDGQNNLTVNA